MVDQLARIAAASSIRIKDVELDLGVTGREALADERDDLE